MLATGCPLLNIILPQRLPEGLVKRNLFKLIKTLLLLLIVNGLKKSNVGNIAKCVQSDLVSKFLFIQVDSDELMESILLVI